MDATAGEAVGAREAGGRAPSSRPGDCGGSGASPLPPSRPSAEAATLLLLVLLLPLLVPTPEEEAGAAPRSGDGDRLRWLLASPLAAAALATARLRAAAAGAAIAGLLLARAVAAGLPVHALASDGGLFFWIVRVKLRGARVRT
jgi:hypothetical protein